MNTIAKKREHKFTITGDFDAKGYLILLSRLIKLAELRDSYFTPKGKNLPAAAILTFRTDRKVEGLESTLRTVEGVERITRESDDGL